MKTPDEIKKGLECCQGQVRCEECPYEPECDLPFGDAINADAIVLIQQLESTYSQVSKALCGKENATAEEIIAAFDQVKRERDAAVEELRNDLPCCYHCKHHEEGYCASIAKMDGSCYEWRGVKEDNP